LDKTTTQFKRLAIVLLTFATIAYALLARLLDEEMSSFFENAAGFREVLTFLLSVSAVYSVVLVLPLLMFERWGWRIVNPKIDFNGYWKLKVTYRHIERSHKDPAMNLEMPAEFLNTLTIRQTPFRVRIVEAVAVPFEQWTASNCEVTRDGGISFVYKATRQVESGSRYPTDFGGLETAQVDSRDYRGRPKTLRGQFFHIAKPNIPLYRGTSFYQRVNRKAHVELTRKTASDAKVTPEKRHVDSGREGE